MAWSLVASLPVLAMCGCQPQGAGVPKSFPQQQTPESSGVDRATYNESVSAAQGVNQLTSRVAADGGSAGNRVDRSLDGTLDMDAPASAAFDGQTSSASSHPPPAIEYSAPLVVKPYHDWTLDETAVDSLGRIGRPAVPGLMQMLRHPLAYRREQAAQILARIGPDAREAVPVLVETLRDPNENVRKAAARALGQIGPSAREAVDPLMEILEEDSR
ncbi:MAG: HEAT repeat domain-containing protein [Pirellulaceae bacterium]|nr:HEAT repeat domain-containing protein [Planctomycetales bacterium]